MRGEEMALAYALEAHEGQTYGPTEPYIWHPIRVASYFRPEERLRRTVALLHDTVEDGGRARVDALTELDMMFGEPVALCVEALSRVKALESYGDYIERVARAPLAAIDVKMADLSENLAGISDYKPGLRRRYEEARKRLGRVRAERLKGGEA